MKLEFGKMYIRRDGLVTGALKEYPDNDKYIYYDAVHSETYTVGGVMLIGRKSPEDLVREVGPYDIRNKDGYVVGSSGSIGADAWSIGPNSTTTSATNTKAPLPESIVVPRPKAPMSQEEYLHFLGEMFGGMQDLIRKKNTDYTAGAGDAFANFRRSEAGGVDLLKSAWVRWGDKVQRVDAFFINGMLSVENEGLEDGLKDIIGYSAIMLGILEESKKS